jgi:hypothetical protein
MRKYNRYLISDNDNFDPANYSSIEMEVSKINRQTAALPVKDKSDILITFLKEHSIKTSLAQANPQLVKLIESGEIFNGDIEALLESAQKHSLFSAQLEKYLRESFDAPASAPAS